jgi:hypothetical protein
MMTSSMREALMREPFSTGFSGATTLLPGLFFRGGSGRRTE